MINYRLYVLAHRNYTGKSERKIIALKLYRSMSTSKTTLVSRKHITAV